ncbi:MAG: hypothetical protein AAGI54_08165 [Planctomycetota bacterium]
MSERLDTLRMGRAGAAIERAAAEQAIAVRDARIAELEAEKAELQKQLDDEKAENERLRGVMEDDNAEWTMADGSVAYAGMTVFVPQANGSILETEIGVSTGYEGEYSADECYPTRQAAESAMNRGERCDD